MHKGKKGHVAPEIRPSIRDVAARAHVSPGSVSNVINGRRKRDDAIGRAVLAAIKELDYRTNTMASNLRRTQSSIIGLVIPDFENPFFAELVAELERCAEATHYRIVATSSRESVEIENREVREFLGWRVAGLLIAPTLGSRNIEHYLVRQQVPAVVVDRIPADSEIDGVGVDNAKISQEVMAEIIALGHRDILVCYLGEALQNVAERVAGIRAAEAACPHTVHIDYLPCGTTVASSEAALKTYFAANPMPTAIFCLFNPATLAVYGLVRGHRLEIGCDVALVGFDDSAWMAHMTPPVAAVAQPVAEIAREAWKSLLRRIDGETGEVVIKRLPCTLNRRGTLSPPSKMVGVA